MTTFDTSQSLCREYPTSWWYPEVGRQSVINANKAISICKECPVRIPCLMYSLVNETHGIWGGMKEGEREMERRRLNIQLSPEALSNASQTTKRVARRLERMEKDGTTVHW